MSNVLFEQQERVGVITLNRVEKHNAFDDVLLMDLQRLIETATAEPSIHVLVLKANGPHFSAGADMAWMQRMAGLNHDENQADALILARVMSSLYHCTKPTMAMIQGAAYGGGAGLVAACDIAVAADTARFCFSEVTLGLIPAVISPYVIKAIGQRAATALFMTAEVIDAHRAEALQLIQHCVAPNELLDTTMAIAHKMARAAPMAIRACKALVRTVDGKPIDVALQKETAALIAEKRVSPEGQKGLTAFLNKKTPVWD